nr:hypothetical protein [Tanacetum cinerariifolium]
YHLNPRYAIKECLSCGALYTGDFCCSKGNVEDKILVPKLPKNYARCGHPVDGPYCQGCTLLRKKLEEDLVTYFQDFQNTFKSSNDSTNVVNAPREPFIVKQDHGVNSSQNPPHVDECAHIGYNCPPKVLINSNPKPYNQTMNNEPPKTLPSFDPTCYSEKENSLPCVSKPNIVDESPNVLNPPPQPPLCSCEFYGSNAQYGHYCTPQVPFINPEPGYSQDFNFPQDIHDFQQQYLCCDQFTKINVVNVRLVELCTLWTIVVLMVVSGTRSFVILTKHPTCLDDPLRIVLTVETRLMVIIVKDVLFSERNLKKICLHIVLKMEFFKILPSHLMTIPTLLTLFESHSLSIKTPVKIPHKVLHKSTTIIVTVVVIRQKISFAINVLVSCVGMVLTMAIIIRRKKIPACHDDDDDDYAIAITHKEPDNSLSMRDEHLNTILVMELDAFINSSVENLVPNPSESEGERECDSLSDEDIPKKIYSNPLFNEEIFSMKIDPHHFNAESDLIESLLNHDSSIISSSSKIDSLFDEFTGELILLKSISSGINESDRDPEEKTRFIKRSLYDNSSPRPPEEFISKNSDAAFESFSPSPIPIEDSGSLMEEIDLSFTPGDPMPPDIEEDDYDSERDILILEEFLSNDSLLFPENESFYFDIPSSSRPPAKPPDGNSGILNVKMMGDISKQKVPMPRHMITLVPNQEKSPNLLPHLGHEAFQPSVECRMMIYGKNTPILDVLFFHFYPLDQFKYGGIGSS